MRFWRIVAATGMMQALFFSGCDIDEQKSFPTKQAATGYFYDHRSAYQALAADWLASGHHDLTWYGLAYFRAVYTWNGYRVSPSGRWWKSPYWTVTHWDGHEYIVQPAASFDETARISGVSGEDVSRWHHRLESLRINSIMTLSTKRNGIGLKYVELEYFPVRHPYGFRFAPPNDATAKDWLDAWARRGPGPGHRMDSLGNGWFYYEGVSSTDTAGTNN